MASLLLRGAQALIVACAAGSAGAASGAPSWMQPAFDAGQSWNNPYETTLRPGNVAGLRRVASAQPGFNSAGQPTQSGGALYICTDRYGLGDLAEPAGTLRWSTIAIGGACNSPLLASGNTYTAASKLVGSTRVNTLSATRQSDGSVVWQTDGPTDPVGGPSWLGFNEPTLSKGRLFVSSGRSLVSAYGASDGQLAWRVETGYLNNQVAVDGNYVYTSTWGEGGPSNVLFAYRATDGTLAWSQPTDASESEYPATANGGRVFVLSDSGFLRAFEGAKGTPLWSRQFTGFFSAPPVAGPQAIIVATSRSSLVALDPATGDTLWTSTLRGGDGIASNLALGGGVLYAATTDFSGNLVLAAFDARSGQQVLKMNDPLGGSYANVSVTGGRVFVTVGGALVVFGL